MVARRFSFSQYQINQLLLLQISDDVVQTVGQGVRDSLCVVRYMAQLLKNAIVQVARQEVVAHDVGLFDDIVFQFKSHLQFANAFNPFFVNDGVTGIVAVCKIVRQVVLFNLFDTLHVIGCQGDCR